MGKWLLIFFGVSIITKSYSQKQANIWYFGHNAGLDFSSGSPAILTDGQIYTDEGVASICDVKGHLLFYTEGTKIWNARHSVMPNGDGLLGSFSSSQSAIVVPKMDDPLRYYVFTVEQLGMPNGFNYSIVNMALDNGLGDVEVKNVPLQTPVCEKLTAVKHCNGKDIWVIVHGFNSDAYYSYLVSAAGVGAPVISHAGTFISSINGEYAIGYLKASPDGKKLAAAHHHIGVDLLDFDNSTGIVSNGRSLFLPSETYSTPRGPYGVEFSSNSKLLYISADYFDFNDISDFSVVLQYNTSLPDLASIQASKRVIYRQQPAWAAENFGALQMAPDGKIYMGELTQSYLSVINKPDSVGTTCEFIHAALPLTKDNVTVQSTYGLPSFIQSYWWPGFTFRGACDGNLIHFDDERSSDIMSVKWDFGDTSSGINNFSVLDSPQHLYSNNGLFDVTLIRQLICGNDTVTKQIQVGQVSVSLGNDTLLCGKSQFVLTPKTSGMNNSYMWQDSSSNSNFAANHDGLYWVQITDKDNGCMKRDTVEIKFEPIPEFDLGPDLSKCNGDTVKLSADVSDAKYLWSTGSTAGSIYIAQSGSYWLNVSLNGCSRSDTTKISFYPYPTVNFGKDTTVCEGQNLLLDAKSPGSQYLWQDNSTTPTYMVTKKGTYSAKVTNNGCSSIASINVNYNLKPAFTLGNDTVICNAQAIMLEPKIQNDSGVSWIWNNGATDPNFTVIQAGEYILKASNFCGSLSDTIKVSQGVCKLYIPTAFTPNNDGLNDIFRAGFGENIVQYSLDVYNRWGQKVFHSTDINKGWDGKMNGTEQPNGAYAWMIQYKIIADPQEHLLKGTVMLIR